MLRSKETFSFFSKVKRNRMICIKTFSREEWRILILVSVWSEKNSRVYAICASSSHSFLFWHSSTQTAYYTKQTRRDVNVIKGQKPLNDKSFLTMSAGGGSCIHIQREIVLFIATVYVIVLSLSVSSCRESIRDQSERRGFQRQSGDF